MDENFAIDIRQPRLYEIGRFLEVSCDVVEMRIFGGHALKRDAIVGVIIGVRIDSIRALALRHVEHVRYPTRTQRLQT